jgi:hypothetical protein
MEPRLLTAEEWNRLTPSQRAHHCFEMAENATKLANFALPDMVEAYEHLAEEWLKLAVEIEQTVD